MLSGIFPIENSDLYYILIEERVNIAKNKWYLSEQAGFDVGWEFAKYDWNMRFRSIWLKQTMSRQTGKLY